MLTEQGDDSSLASKQLSVVYVGGSQLGSALAEELPSAAVVTENRGADALASLESREVDCVVAETDFADATGPEFLETVGELYPDAARVLLGESVEDAPEDVAFVPTRPRAGLPARAARRVESAVERRAAERDRDRFRSLAVESPDPIITIDEECTVVFANEATERVFGRDPSSVVGESVERLLADRIYDEFRASIRELAANEGRVERDYVQLLGEHSDGGEIPLAISFRETVREGTHYFSGIVRDVSERKRLEDRLEAEKRKTKQLHEVAVMLEERETPEEVCQLAVETAENLLEFDLCAVDIVEDGELVPQAVSKGVPSDGYYTTTPLDADDNLAARAFREDASLCTSDLRDEGVNPAASGYRSALTVPVGGIGVFQAVSEDPDAFDESDRELAELLVAHVAQALGRIRSERALEAERDRFAALFENTRDAVIDYEMRDGEPVFRSVNDAFEEIFGYDAETVVGESLIDYIVPDDSRTEAQRHVARMDRGEHVDAEVRRETADGLRDFLLRTAGVPGDESGGYVIYTDITERKEREEMLDALHGATRELMAAESQRDICETAVETGREVLDIPHATVFRWNDDTEQLEPYVLPEDTVDVIGDAPTFERGEGLVGHVFDTGEAVDFDNAWDDPRAHDDGSEGIRAFGAFPLGDWGVMTIASPSVGVFDEYDIDLTRVLAANTEVALNRAAREAELAEQRSQLAELDRINEVIRDVDQLLVEATTREEIAQSVCDRLVDSPEYRFAWIDPQASRGKGVRPATWAGVEEGYIDKAMETYDETPVGPPDRALRTGEVQVVEDVGEDPEFEPWREEALERGYRSEIAVPLRYRDTVYGVLCIYADRADAFDDRERAVLAELGETIGHAINAVENKKALLSDGVVEIEFDIYGGDGFFTRVPREEGGRFSLEGVTITTDGSFVYFMTVSGLDPERVRERADRSEDVERCRLVNEHDDGHLFEFVYTGPSPLPALADHGGTLREATFTADGGWSTVELPRTANVRSVIESIQDALPETKVVAQREHERPERTVEEFSTTLEDDLTDRQRSALEAAFYAGFFEWPRESNGEEVAESLGVSSPTFHQHLRVGERKLLSAFLEE